MHIGNLRTALLNYLFALKKKAEGEDVSFVLRIDDTDRERSKPEYEAAVYDCLKWMGMKWDRLEHQSARLNRYDEVVERLKAEGRLYACYETAEELECKRRRRLARKLPPVYDREGLRLTAEDRAKLEAEGRRPHYRFRLDYEEMAWDDMVRGRCSYHGEHLSDPIVVREDGTLPYLLPSVVDDIDFGITHVIRGEDHVTNTAVQIQMFKALGGTIPVFGHPPLLTGKEGKLSKRTGSVNFMELRDDGIEPMTVACLLSSIGTSDATPVEQTLEALARHFDLAKFGRAQPHFDTQDLFKLNPRIVRELPPDTVNERLAQKGMPAVDPRLWTAVAPNLTTLDDLTGWIDRCSKGKVFCVSEQDRAFARTAADLLPDGEFDDGTFALWTAALKEKTGRKGRDLFHPLRLALTGVEQGPELKALLPVLGREETVARLRG